MQRSIGVRLGWLATLLGMSGISLVLVSTPVFAETIATGSCDVTAASPVAAVATTVLQAADATRAGTSFWHHAWSFGKGLALGAATGVAVTAGVAALAATAPIWVTAAATTVLIGAGVYGAWQLHSRWSRMSTDGKLFTAGNVFGGIAAGGLSGAVSRGVGGWLASGGGDASAATAGGAISSATRAPASVPAFQEGSSGASNAFHAVLQYWSGDAAPDPSAGLSIGDAPALARQYGYPVTHIQSGATAAEVAGATDQGLPVLAKIVVDGNGNPTVLGAPGAREEIVVVENMTEDGEVFAKRGGASGDAVWSIPAFDASMRSAGGEIVIVHGPAASGAR